MADQYWKLKPGLNSVGSYQVSGMPFASASIAASSATQVRFPSVTKWIQVINKTGNPVKVGFSRAGVNGTPSNYYFTVNASGSVSSGAGGYGKSDVLDLKVGEIWLKGSNNVDVIAGLTTINTGSVSMSPATPSTSRSWSGSAGVG